VDFLTKITLALSFTLQRQVKSAKTRRPEEVRPWLVLGRAKLLELGSILPLPVETLCINYYRRFQRANTKAHA
jgi:hypothetical protein